MSRTDSVSRRKMMFQQFAACLSVMLILFSISIVVGCSNGVVGDESASKSDQTKKVKPKAGDAKAEANTDDKKGTKVSKSGKTYPENPRELTDAQWRERLTAMQYKVARREGTERAFTGELWDNKKDGVYVCVCCGEPLFDSKTKYESGTGWPSFWKPIDNANVGEKEDYKLFSRRVEVICANCDAHLGHVFEDGPEPTGLRYCLNSAALDFEEREEEAKEKEDEKKSSTPSSSSIDEESE